MSMNAFFNFTETNFVDNPPWKIKIKESTTIKLEDIDSPISMKVDFSDDNSKMNFLLSEGNEEKDVKYDRIPQSNGEWKGEKGNSEFVPDPNEIPPEKRGNTKTNEDNLTNRQIAEKYGVDPDNGFLYEQGDLNLENVSKGTVEIEDMSENRYTKNGQEGNFEKADRKIAEQRHCSADEVAKWRAENNYTYHERQDCKTMQKVPNEIHGNLPHKGGVSVIKERNNAEEGIFDE